VLKFNESPGIEMDQASVALNDAAEKRAAEKKISFGEAMKELRAEGFNAEVDGGASRFAV
jgi:hypothetical protein